MKKPSPIKKDLKGEGSKAAKHKTTIKKKPQVGETTGKNEIIKI